MVSRVKIDGLADFNRNLRKLDTNAPKALRLALNDAAEVVVNYAKPRVPSRSGAARRTIKARSTRTLARVTAGGNKAPYYPWLDFGGRVGRKRSVYRVVRKHGRYLYQGYYATRDEFTSILERNLRRVVTESGLAVT